jgi:hypothetical protein
MPNKNMTHKEKTAIILLADALTELAAASVITIGMDNAVSIMNKAQASIKMIKQSSEESISNAKN